MDYKKETDILPCALLSAVQQYIDGENIYIQRKENAKKSWGVNTGTKETIQLRNKEIIAKHLSVFSVAELSEQYFLSGKTIYKILRTVKNG